MSRFLERWFNQVATIDRRRTLSADGEPAHTSYLAVPRCRVENKTRMVRVATRGDIDLSGYFYMPAGTDVAVGDKIAEGSLNVDSAAFREVLIVNAQTDMQGQPDHVQAGVIG